MLRRILHHDSKHCAHRLLFYLQKVHHAPQQSLSTASNSSKQFHVDNSICGLGERILQQV